MLFLTKPKPTTNRITISILPNRIGNQIKRIIPILFQVGLGHGPLARTWAIAQQLSVLLVVNVKLQRSILTVERISYFGVNPN